MPGNHLVPRWMADPFSVGQVGEILGEGWMVLSDKQRGLYEAEAAADGKRYEHEILAYNVSVTIPTTVRPIVQILWDRTEKKPPQDGANTQYGTQCILWKRWTMDIVLIVPDKMDDERRPRRPARPMEAPGIVGPAKPQTCI